MAKRIVVTPKQKAAAALSVKRSAANGRYVSKATQAISTAQPKGARGVQQTG